MSTPSEERNGVPSNIGPVVRRGKDHSSHQSKTQAIKQRAEIEERREKECSETSSDGVSSISGEDGTSKQNSGSSTSSEVAVCKLPESRIEGQTSKSHPSCSLRNPSKLNMEQLDKLSNSTDNNSKKAWNEESSSETVSSLSGESKWKCSPPALDASRKLDRENAGASGSSESDGAESSSSELLKQKKRASGSDQRLMADARMKSNGFLPADKDKIVRFHAKGGNPKYNESSDESVSTLSDQQKQAKLHQEDLTKTSKKKKRRNKGTTVHKPSTTCHASSSTDLGNAAISEQNYCSSNTTKIVTGSEFSSSGSGGDMNSGDNSGGDTGSGSGTGSRAMGSGDDAASPREADKQNLEKKSTHQSNEKRNLDLPTQTTDDKRSKIARTGEKDENAALQPDSDASLTAPEGQLSKNPHFTDKEATVAARREYNRRNAARARKRAKSQVETLQEQASSLGDSVTKLRQNNDRLLDKLKYLKEQNVEIVRNHQILKSNVEKAAHSSAQVRHSGLPQQHQGNQPIAASVHAQSSQQSIEQLLLSVLSQALSTNSANASMPVSRQQQQQPMDQLRNMIESAFQTPQHQHVSVQQSSPNIETLLAMALQKTQGSGNNPMMASNHNATNEVSHTVSNNNSANSSLLTALQNALQENGGSQEHQQQQRGDSTQNDSWF